MTPSQASVGRLVVCPTPIGNLEDVTLRVLATLREADVVACEDTRRTRVLLDRHAISAPLVSFHDHNEAARARELLGRVRGGELVALVSDAGTPLISDPGWALVRACIAAGLALEALPGPSAVLPALILSGLPAERWRFVGFLPRGRRELSELLGDARETSIAFESPRRLARTLEHLAAQDPDRELAVCRELTKLHEEVRRGTAAELASHYRERQARGEVVLVVGAADSRDGEAHVQDLLAALRQLVDAGARPRAAATVLARLTDVSANTLYAELMRGGSR
jgi:16S rRNA (cytidine1402-2'-O)-methyltransferase